jgi:hypothetical protein
MTHQEARMGVGRHPYTAGVHPAPALEAQAPRTGYVDGAWWPWSDDLTNELPDLLAVLSVRLGRIDRVMYNLGEWATAPAKTKLGERVVRLDGYRRQPINTLEVLGVNHDRIVLLVVPPNTKSDRAHATMMAAAAPSDDSSVEGLLTAGV